MSLLTVRFAEQKQKTYKSHRPVHLKVILTNTSNRDLSVLTWNTPLDDIVTDCLQVTRNGKTVKYDGPLVKRGLPTAKDYVTIKAGQSVETKFPVSAAYDTSQPGTYQVKLKSPIPDVVPSVTGLAKMLRTANRAPTMEAISHKTTFKVKRGRGKTLTLGAAARNMEKKMKGKARKPSLMTALAGKKKPLLKAALPSLTSGGTATKKKAALRAHADGYDLTVKALTTLKDNAHYLEWFGAHSTKRFTKVKANYTAVQTRMETIRFTYNLTGHGCGAGVFAYTYKGTSTIWFCSQFWAAPAKGTDSKAGTVVHEHTHSDASTDDIQYGQAGARNLAASNPNDAIRNADNHEYFAGG